MRGLYRTVIVVLIGTTLRAGPGDDAAGAGQAGGGAFSRLDHLVVIYQENRSFDNLYGLWPGAEGLSSPISTTPRQIQVDQAGAPYACLAQKDPHLKSPAPLAETCTDPRGFRSHFRNELFAIDGYVPLAQKTEDLVHRFYQEQYQISGGRMDRFTTGSDTIGLTQGYYDTKNLPVYRYLTAAGAPPSVVLDHFFHAAFGGSFLNHQWLVAARTPVFAGALDDGAANDLHSVVDANGMPINYPLYTSPLRSQVKDGALTPSCHPPAGTPPTPAGLICGDYAVNTLQPASQPYLPASLAAQRLPLLTSPTIGDELTAKGVTWAWYSGGWDNAAGKVRGRGWTNGDTPGTCADPDHNPSAAYPYCADRLFQYHHQAFNYFANYAEGAAGRALLRDERDFLAEAAAGTLPAVSFVKPLGEHNEHPGYADVNSGERHLIGLIEALKGSPAWPSTAIVITYDEHGGFWDHVPPPTARGVSDPWGPGVRVPTLVISPLLAKTGVDHAEHDTTSILATIERRWNIAPLGTRDAAVASLAPLFGAERDSGQARSRGRRADHGAASSISPASRSSRSSRP
jgi:acid phosphatase